MSQHVVRHDISLHQSMPIISVIISNIKCFCLNTDIDINNIAIINAITLFMVVFPCYLASHILMQQYYVTRVFCVLK